MAKEAEQSEGAAPAGMSTKKMIIVVLAAVLVSTSVIAGVLVYVLGGHRGAATAEAGGGGEGKEHAEKKKEPPVVFAMEPFIVNITDGQSIRYLKLKVELQTSGAGEEGKKEMEAFLPPMRDAVLTLLSTKTMQDIQDLPGKTRLKNEILAALSKVAPQGKIKQVFFTDFMIQ